jgi:hypothetical protein
MLNELSILSTILKLSYFLKFLQEESEKFRELWILFWISILEVANIKEGKSDHNIILYCFHVPEMIFDLVSLVR